MEGFIWTRYSPGSIVANRYEVESLLGVGGNGFVLKAVDRELQGKTVALKILHPHRVFDSRVRARFINEILLTRTLTHPNIARVYENGITEADELYLAMEFVEGASLSTLLRESGAIRPFDRVVKLLQQICEALSYAHGLGILHRDLKPDNILLTPSGDVKLVDFGIARRLDAEDRITRTGESLGTPYYMAPEMIGGLNVDARSDIYALGVVAYELSEGVRPFQGPTYFDLLSQHQGARVPPFRSGAPGWFRELVCWCLEKSQERRPHCCTEVLEALKRGTAAERQSLRFIRSRIIRRSRSLLRAAGISSTVLLLLTGALIAIRSSQKASARVAYPLLLVEARTGLRLERARQLLGWPLVGVDDEGIRFLLRNGDTHRLAVMLKVWRGPLPPISATVLNGGYGTSEHVLSLVGAAAMHGNEALLEAILEAGVDPNEKLSFGGYPLHLACAVGSEGSVKALLDKGAYVNVRDHQGMTPLHFAVGRDARHSVHLLLAANADLSASNLMGQTPLMIAIRSVRRELFFTLLDRGASVMGLEQGTKKTLTILSLVSESLLEALESGLPDEKLRSRAEIYIEYVYRIGGY